MKAFIALMVGGMFALSACVSTNDEALGECGPIEPEIISYAKDGTPIYEVLGIVVAAPLSDGGNGGGGCAEPPCNEPPTCPEPPCDPDPEDTKCNCGKGNGPEIGADGEDCDPGNSPNTPAAGVD